MKEFYNITLKQIFAFSKVLANYKIRNIDYVKEKFVERSSNFSLVISFLADIKQISVFKKKIKLSDKYQSVLDRWKEKKVDSQIIEFFQHSLFESAFLKKEVVSYLKKFTHKNNRLEYRPNKRQNIEDGNIRFFLIEFEIIKLTKDRKTYYLEEDNIFLSKEIVQEVQLNPSHFRKILRQKEKLGNLAEKEILKYEKKRLIKFPHLLKKIQHVAKCNINAGFDIISYENCKNKEQVRYIEVKAVSPINLRFYISKNEIEHAKKKASQYFLYLVPVLAKNNFDIDNLRIIQNPYKNIFNSKAWNKDVESYSFSMI